MLLRKILLFMGVALLVFFTASTVMAEHRAGAITITPMFGSFRFDSDLGLDRDDFPDWFGYGLGYNFTKNWTAELLLGYAKPYLAPPANLDIDVYQWELDFLFHLFPENRLTPYLEAGLGGLTYDPERRSAETKALGNIGVGLKYYINDIFSLRADVRQMMEIDGFSDMNRKDHWSYGFGVTMSFGGEEEVMAAPEPPPAPAPEPAPAPAPVVGPCPDRDGDGVCDDVDKCPNTPAGVKVDERGCWVISCVVLFDFDKATLKPEAKEELDKACDILKNDDLKIEVQGYTCDIGTGAYNQNLSERRANAVKDYLVEKGIDEGRLTAVGYGESNPAVSNDSKENRMKNRRVEFKSMD